MPARTGEEYITGLRERAAEVYICGDQVKDVTLDKALNGLGFSNLFRTVHEPPKITLDFARKCQFRTPPYLYGSPK